MTPEPGPTIAQSIAKATAGLSAAGVDDPAIDARLLAAEAFGLDRAALLARRHERPEPAAAARFAGLVARRAGREPVARILGRRGFWTLDLMVTPATLDPRPDTEAVVEAALSDLPDRGAALRILDLGTGSGCLLLALLSELPNAFGLGIDCSLEACRTAAGNAARNGLAERARLVVGDWTASLAGQFDLVVSNPPYVASGDIAGLAPEVAGFEPLQALDGGLDGLDAYRSLAARLPAILAPGAAVVVEIGAGQSEGVTAAFAARGLVPAGVRPDLNGVVRALTFRAADGKGAAKPPFRQKTVGMARRSR